jgi:hypothetical protein
MAKEPDIKDLPSDKHALTSDDLEGVVGGTEPSTNDTKTHVTDGKDEMDY